MTLVFCDSFDHWAIGDILTKYTTNPSGGCSITTGRFGSGLIFNVTNVRVVTKTVPALTTYIAGFAFNSARPTGAGPINFGFREGGTPHVDLRMDANGHLSVTRNGTTLATGTTSLAPNTWYYIEILATISDTVGVVQVKLNGTDEINITGQDTRNGLTGVINEIAFGQLGTNNSQNPIFDDLYVVDTTGSAPTNTFLGDVRIEALFPNGDGNSSQFLGSDGNQINNSLLVDEATPNADTDYVEDGTLDDKDTYAYTNLTPVAGTVYGVQIIPSAKKTDAGTRLLKNIARLSGTEVDSATGFTLANSYLFYPEIREAKPGGGVWTIADVNSAEFGFKVA